MVALLSVRRSSSGFSTPRSTEYTVQRFGAMIRGRAALDAVDDDLAGGGGLQLLHQESREGAPRSGRRSVGEASRSWRCR